LVAARVRTPYKFSLTPAFSSNPPPTAQTQQVGHRNEEDRMALSFLQSHWAAIVANYTPTQIMLTGNFMVQTFAFWIPSLFYLSIDLTDGHPLGRYKIQPAKKVTAREVLQCLKTVLFNQYLIATPLDISLALLAMHLGRPPALRITADLPSVRETVRDFGISIVVREILFYYSHRLIHIPVLYKRIHKIHHKFTAPIAPSAEYAHPVEHLVSNVLPIIVGLFPKDILSVLESN
jgi:sterol desaturase/sphingolipid hydroxylase (fatty acid hydroxylase superfamily)